MSALKFNPEAEAQKEWAIRQAKADQPSFASARAGLLNAHSIVVDEYDPLVTSLYTARITNDMGVVDVRQGLYARNYQGASDDHVLGLINVGINQIESSYTLLKEILRSDQDRLSKRGFTSAVHAHICGTMNTWFRATRTAQLVNGTIGLDKVADTAAIKAGWMRGRGKPDEPGAWIHGREGDNGYFSTQTAFLGLHGERINGRLFHAMYWVGRGVPELVRTVMHDEEHRKQAVFTAGRLSVESITRGRAIRAALDHRTF